jgi:hypothetical protein
MTDTMPEQAADQSEDWGDVEQSADATYPEWPANPHNHRFTISINGQGPMLVVRANTADEVKQAFEELESGEAGAAIGRAWAAIKAGAALGSGLGATPVPAGAPGPQGMPQVPATPTPPPFGPNVSVPQAPGFQGNQGFTPPPAPPQGGFNGGGQQKQARDNTPEFQQNGWYALNVPFPQGKKQFDAICAQYGMQKGRPTEGGSYSFNGANKTWYVSPQFAGAFQQFQPVPA